VPGMGLGGQGLTAIDADDVHGESPRSRRLRRPNVSVSLLRAPWSGNVQLPDFDLSRCVPCSRSASADLISDPLCKSIMTAISSIIFRPLR
jgi:hypothetical protein